MIRATKGAKIQQVLGILVMVVMVVVIATKGFTDISLIARDAGDDFWRSLVRYFLSNMAGGGGDWRSIPD